MNQAIEDQDWYRAARDAVRARHAGKLDKLGRPYHDHFERVAARLRRLFPGATRAQIEAALLHDALEPGEADIASLCSVGVSEEAIRIIERITLPRDGRSYLDYIAELVSSGDRDAIEVKLADNLDATEFYSTRPTAEARALMQDQYDPSRRMLQDGLISAELRRR
jgi:(p)ppGpp synthase/HD superfamily hydrolase